MKYVKSRTSVAMLALIKTNWLLCTWEVGKNKACIFVLNQCMRLRCKHFSHTNREWDKVTGFRLHCGSSSNSTSTF